MRDSRLAQITAALDDARTTIIDIVDDGSVVGTASLRDFNHLDAARQCVNAAIKYTEMAGGQASPDSGDVA